MSISREKTIEKCPYYRYTFNGELAEPSIFNGSMDLGERFYDARLGRMFSTDPLETKYPWQSTYAYCGNSPIACLDFKGMGDGSPEKHTIKKGETLWSLAKSSNGKYTVKDLLKWNPGVDPKKLKIGSQINVSDPEAKISLTFFASGAGHDKDGRYLKQTLNDLKTTGISNTPIDVNAHRSGIDDGLFATSAYSNYPYSKLYIGGNYMDGHQAASGLDPSIYEYRITPNILKAANQIYNEYLKNQKLGNINLIGYSYGSVLLAQTALYLTNERKIRIHSLVLIGTTVNGKLKEALVNNPNIDLVIFSQIEGDDVPYKGVMAIYSLWKAGDDHPHYKYAFNRGAQANRIALFKSLKKLGVY